MKDWMPFEWIAALRFLREGRTQSLLIIVGVGVGVSVIVFLSALLSGLQANLVKRTLSAQSHIVVLPQEEAARALQPAETSLITRQKQAQRLRSIDQWQALRQMLVKAPDIYAVSPVASGPAFAVRGDANKSVTLIGVEPENFRRVIMIDEKMVSGSLRLNAGDTLIGTELAKDLGADIGDKIRLTSSTGVADTFTISGIFDLGNKGANQRNVYVGLHSAQTLLDLVGGVSSIEISVKDYNDAEIIAQRIQRSSDLQADSWIKSNAQFFTALASQRFSSGVIRFFVGLSAAFGIASVLVVSVVQRAKEIGILRAMGTSQGQILRIFLLQGGIVGLLGSVLGALLGGGFLGIWRTLIKNPDGTPLFDIHIEPSLVLITCLGAGLVGILAALIPARRAAQLDPVVAIRG